MFIISPHEAEYQSTHPQSPSALISFLFIHDNAFSARFPLEERAVLFFSLLNWGFLLFLFALVVPSSPGLMMKELNGSCISFFPLLIISEAKRPVIILSMYIIM